MSLPLFFFSAFAHLLNIDPRPLDPVRVCLPKFRDDVDRVQPRVLRQGVRHDLQGLGEGLHAEGVHPRGRVALLLELKGDLGLGGPAPGDHEPLLYEGTDDALGVMNGTVGLGEDELVGTTEEDRHGLSGVLCLRGGGGGEGGGVVMRN